MTAPLFVRISLAILALLSPFLFPAYFSVLIILLASFFMPPIALLSGMLADLVYYVPGHWPLATLLGLLAALVLYGVQVVIKARIIGG